MYKVLKHTCWVIVLPVRSFVLSHLRCRRRRDLLKVPINRALLSIELGSQWLRASKNFRGVLLSLGTPSVQRVQLKYLLSDMPWKIPLNSYTSNITKIYLNTFSVSLTSLAQLLLRKLDSSRCSIVNSCTWLQLTTPLKIISSFLPRLGSSFKKRPDQAINFFLFFNRGLF